MYEKQWAELKRLKFIKLFSFNNYILYILFSYTTYYKEASSVFVTIYSSTYIILRSCIIYYYTSGVLTACS